MPRASLRVEIEHLALFGVERRDAADVAAALEAALARAASDPAARFASAQIDMLPPVGFRPGSRPEQTGGAAAGAVWSAIMGGAR
jgi:hypothetical protein